MITVPRRGCLMFLLCGIIGYALTMAFSYGVARTVDGLLPQDVVMVGTICVGIPLWPVLSLVCWVVLVERPRWRRETAAREAFLRREPLSQEAFASPFAQAAVAAEVRAELHTLINDVEVAERLLPSDPVRATCGLMGVWPDDLDWAEFVLRLETRFGVSIPNEANRDATVAQLIAWCMEKTKPA